MWNRKRRSIEVQRPAAPGVIDTIGLAYSRLVARPWVVLGPILLDLYLWLGLRVTAGPLVLKLAELVRPVRAVGDAVADTLEARDGYNLAEFLSLQLPSLRFPTFLPLLVDHSAIALGDWSPEVNDAPWWALAVLAPLLLALGLLAGSAFLLWLGDVARGAEHRFDGRVIVETSKQLLLWVLAAIGLLVLICWPLLVAQAAFVFAGVGSSGFIALLLLIPAGIGFVLFFFSAHAIVLDRVTAIEAFRSSYLVVRTFGTQSLGFVVSYLVVTGGFPFFWRLLISEPPGALIAIIGNAFVSSGMIAAGMIYYEDRAALVGAASRAS
jgi:hypothetical protein